MDQKTEKKIRRIVITGGPCSGKSTFLSYIASRKDELGYSLLIDQESATDLISGGISPATMGMVEFQKYVVALQLKKEELFCNAAKEIAAKKVLVLMDRGILDDKGYVTEEEFTEILKNFSMTEADLPRRYDMVLHLTTAAKGNSGAYTLENNNARYETREGAVLVDDMLLKSWKVHTNRVVIDSLENFEEKMEAAFQAVKAFLEQ